MSVPNLLIYPSRLASPLESISLISRSVSVSVSYTSCFVSFFQIPHVSESTDICLFIVNVIFLFLCSYCRGSYCHSDVLPDSLLQLDVCPKQQETLSHKARTFYKSWQESLLLHP